VPLWIISINSVVTAAPGGDAIRPAIESHVQIMSAKPDIQAKADALRQDIEREAREQQGAISQLFGTPPTKPTTRKQHT